MSNRKGTEDWRLDVTTNLAEDWTSPWTGQTAKKGSQLTVVTVAKTKAGKTLTLPHPNATALMLNSSMRAYREASILRRKHKIDDSKNAEVAFKSYPAAFEYMERLMESVLSAHAGLEAFINDQIPEDYEYVSHQRSKVILEISDKEKVQRYVSLSEKISKLLPEVLGCPSPKGKSNSWAEYRKLKRIRDRITHMKTEDRKSGEPDAGTVWQSLINCEPPHSQAMSLIRYFSPHLLKTPRWLNQCPIN